METDHPSSKKASTEPSELNFKLVTEGLGFHPFSDGLPYPPVAKMHRVTNTMVAIAGATMAGTPRFLSPGKPFSQVLVSKGDPKIQVPVVAPIGIQATVGVRDD